MTKDSLEAARRWFNLNNLNEDGKMNLLQQALSSISLDEDGKVGGEYGLHDGFFNILVTIDGVIYYVQGCADNDEFDPYDCGHSEGICGEVNEPLAVKLAEQHDDDICYGYQDVKKILVEAYSPTNE